MRSGDGYQNFEKIRAECLVSASGTKFEDPEFPLKPELLALVEMKPDDVYFKRPPGRTLSPPSKVFTFGISVLLNVKLVNDILTLCHLVREVIPGDAEKDIGWTGI